MRLSAIAKGRAPFFVVIVLFTVSLGISFHGLLEQQRVQKLQLSGNLWKMAQLEIEYLRFLDTFDRFALDGTDAGPGGADRERNLDRRLNVLWSRLPVLLQGEDGQQFAAIPGIHEMARDLEAMLHELDPAISSLPPGNTAAYRVIRSRLQAPAQRIHRLVQDAFQAEKDEIALYKANVRRFELLLAGSLIGILISGSLLVIFLTRHVRMRSLAEAKAREALRSAQAASRAKSEFLATMSHELRTPLNAIIGFADILKQQIHGPIQNPRYREYVDDIHKSGGHLLLIIGDILDLAKLEAGKLELQEEVVDFAEVIGLAVRVVRPDRVETGLDIHLKVAQDLPRLRGDCRLIRQMVLNLLSNAVKFTPASGTVTVEAAVAIDGRPMIRVQDTGIGMAPGDIATALAPFGQVAPVSHRSTGGTGLGLPLVKAFAELHGAILDIVSTPDCGTTATIVFPAERVVRRSETVAA